MHWKCAAVMQTYTILSSLTTLAAMHLRTKTSPAQSSNKIASAFASVDHQKFEPADAAKGGAVNKSQHFGGGGGAPFDDYSWYGKDAWGIQSLQVWSGINEHKICCLIVEYLGGETLTHGNCQADEDALGGLDCQERTPFKVNENEENKEWISSVNLVYGPLFVNGIQFITNTYRESVFEGATDPTACTRETGCTSYTYTPDNSAGIYSFYGMSGNLIDQLGFYVAPTPATCNLVTSVTGFWQAYYYNNGAFTLSLEMGTTHDSESTNSHEWGSTVASQVEMGFDIPLVGDTSVSVSAEFSHGIAQTYSQAFSASSTTTQEVSFDTGGQLWAWVFATKDKCGASNTFKDYVMTRGLDQPPCCPVGWAIDAYTQFGNCSTDMYGHRAPNLCNGLQRSNPLYGVPMVDSSVTDINLKFTNSANISIKKN